LRLPPLKSTRRGVQLPGCSRKFPAPSARRQRRSDLPGPEPWGSRLHRGLRSTCTTFFESMGAHEVSMTLIAQLTSLRNQRLTSSPGLNTAERRPRHCGLHSRIHETLCFRYMCMLFLPMLRDTRPSRSVYATGGTRVVAAAVMHERPVGPCLLLMTHRERCLWKVTINSREPAGRRRHPRCFLAAHAPLSPLQFPSRPQLASHHCCQS